jgi:pyridoxine 5-phosphate synthase
MISLSVNLNKIALLRNSRGGDQPSVLEAAETVLAAGAYGITVHPRPDQRHIRPDDVAALAELLRTRHPGIEFNIEGNPFAPARANGYPGFDALVELARPAQCTLVPDSDEQLTSDHGWDLGGDTARLRDCIARYQALGARVSLFMDPKPEQIERVVATGADRIELYTGPFADVVKAHGIDSAAARASYRTFAHAAQLATSLELGVNAGHDLDLVNLTLFRDIGEVLEVSIGHALVTDALRMGLHTAVRRYLEVLAG